VSVLSGPINHGDREHPEVPQSIHIGTVAAVSVDISPQTILC